MEKGLDIDSFEYVSSLFCGGERPKLRCPQCLGQESNYVYQWSVIQPEQWQQIHVSG